jgi:hypothetical protein
MFQTFPRPAFLNVLQSLSLRYALLFAIVLFTVVMSPSIVNYVTHASWFPGHTALQSEQISSMATNYVVSLTHQEPNFYQ